MPPGTREGDFMAYTFVLVHGAWHGGWCWQRVADRLRGGGHTVFTPTLTGLGERSPPLRGVIRSIVSLDAFVPRNGESVLDLTGPAVQEGVRNALQRGDTAIPPRAAEAFGVNAADRGWVDSLGVAQPIATFTDKIALTGARDRIARKSYIRAKSYTNPGFDRALGEMRSDPSWRSYEVPSGHDVMVDMPERLTEILLEVAQ